MRTSSTRGNGHHRLGIGGQCGADHVQFHGDTDPKRKLPAVWPLWRRRSRPSWARSPTTPPSRRRRPLRSQPSTPPEPWSLTSSTWARACLLAFFHYRGQQRRGRRRSNLALGRAVSTAERRSVSTTSSGSVSLTLRWLRCRAPLFRRASASSRSASCASTEKKSLPPAFFVLLVPPSTISPAFSGRPRRFLNPPR